MDLILRFGLLSMYFVQFWVSLVYKLFSERRQTLPEIDEDILCESAAELTKKIRKGELTSEKVVRAYINRIAAVNPIINAVVESRFTEAINESKLVDELVKNANEIELINLENTKPLLGVPITIKECIAVKELSYTGCSLTRKGKKAPEDAEVVKLIKEAGGIILLVSNTPEYCLSIECYNKMVGRTRNPYNSKHTAGGSSGGEGALIGSAASLIGIGSDIAGSIRFPCAYNGIYGHKPTSRIVPLTGNFPLPTDKRYSDYLVIGPMARYIDDLVLTYKVLAGENAAKLNLDGKVDLKNINVFRMVDTYKDFAMTKIDRQLQKKVFAACEYLRKQFNCQLNEKTKFKFFGHSFEASSALIFTMDDPPDALTDSDVKYSCFKEILKSFAGQSIFSPQTLFFTLMVKSQIGITKSSRDKFIDITDRDKENVKELLGDNGVLILPGARGPAFEHYGYIGTVPDVRINAIINILGLPSTSVPAGFTSDGLPLGIQVVAGPYNDHLCLSVANELNKYFGGWKPPTTTK